MSKPANKTMIGIFVVAAVGLIVVAIVLLGSGKFFKDKPKFVTTLPLGMTMEDIILEAVSYWSMDDLNPSGDLIDYKGKNNGTNKGAIQVKGINGKALNFNGNHYINISNKSSLNLGNLGSSFTVSAWINISSYGNISSNESMVLSKGESWTTAGIEEYELTIEHNGHPTFQFKPGGVDNWWGASATNKLSLNKWYHILGKFNGTRFFIYINGTDYTNLTYTSSNYAGIEYSSPPPISNNPLLIGTRLASSGKSKYSFNGSIDEVMIFNKSLNQIEINLLYNH